ncbi:MAG: HAD-IIB family hydrolase [Thermoanaerobaculia bacterium]|jgi:mannosyl-3-phosphoglycerate phosphatase
MRRPWLLFTDLDGTLLDARDFTCVPARPTLRRLHEREVTIVPVTSKTLAEVVPLSEELGLEGPMVVESGGAIARRDGTGWSIAGRGLMAGRIEELVPEIERRCGARLNLFSRMAEADAVRLSGLHGAALDLARRRQFDVPFTTDAPIEAVAAAAAALGLTVQSGGRFHHLCGRCGKAEAVREIVAEATRRLERTPLVIALGDSAMDAEFVALADVRIAVPRPDGSVDPVLAAIPLVQIAPAPGPEGWSAAVDALLDNDGVSS